MSAESPDITDPRIARARAMREAGAETAEIARACGVGVSTIYRWAEAHGFRVTDLEAAAWAASGRGCSSNVSAFGLDPEAHANAAAGPGSPDQVRGPSGGERVSPPEVPDARSASRDLPQDTAPHAEGGPGSSPGFQAGTETEASTDDAEITAEQWAAMARGLKQRALRLTEAGRLRQAEQALRLAERYERMQASAAPAPAKDDGVDYHALLEAKLTRLHEHLREKAGLKDGEDFTDAHRAALGIKPLPPEYGG
ncbi:MAG: helix-turn-helix domain-containing protein [Oceanicaulis sp.]|jgi:hypothetical protein|nr:helix-turn-helix domain-containing protein [Oceanicaulis sp.]